MTSACLDRHLAPLSTRRAFDRQRNTESAPIITERVDLVGDESPLAAAKDLTARPNSTESRKEKKFPGTLLLSPDAACCNVWDDGGARKFRPRIGDIPRDAAIDRASPTGSPTSLILTSDTGQSPTDAPGPSRVPSITEYGQEVRKDSALYLEEEAETFRRKPATDTPDAPRRQSSGYVSTRGSFDDNRRNSTTTSEDPSPYLHERRRSSKLSSKVLAGRVEESVYEPAPTIDTPDEIMPTTDVHRKVSSPGLDVSNVDETKATPREESQPANVGKLFKASAKPANLSEMESAQPRKNVRLLQKKSKIVLGDTLVSTDGTADQPIGSELEAQREEEEDDDKSQIESRRMLGEGSREDRVDEAASALSGLDLMERSNAQESAPPTIVCPLLSSSHQNSPQGSPRSGKVLSKEGDNSSGNQDDNQNLNEYEVQADIGKGSFGVVKKVYNKYDQTLYAMKILNKKKLMKKAGIFGRVVPGRTSTDPLANVHREIAILKKLDHPNVVKLIEVLDYPDKNNFYLVFELVHRGEILVIPTSHPLEEETARRYFRDVVMGVEYLHYQKIVHRDIKPSNLLVDRNDRIKIADLGVSTELREPGELLSGQIGTPAFSAPETTVTGAEFSGPPCDLWSMGVTLFALVVGDVPWRSSDSKALHVLIRDAPLAFPADSAEISASLRSLIGRMLEKPANQRATIAEVKQHPWLTRDATEPLPSETDNCRVPITVTNEEVTKLGTLVLVKNMLRQHSLQNPFLPKRRTANNEANAAVTTCGSEDQSGVSSSQQHDCFEKTVRSNSAPANSCDWRTRQTSMENQLPSVTEASSQKSEADRR